MPEKSKLATLIDAVSAMVFQKPQDEPVLQDEPVVYEKKKWKKGPRTGSFDLDW